MKVGVNHQTLSHLCQIGEARNTEAQWPGAVVADVWGSRGAVLADIVHTTCTSLHNDL